MEEAVARDLLTTGRWQLPSNRDFCGANHGDVVALGVATGLARTEHFDPSGTVMSTSNSVISPA